MLNAARFPRASYNSTLGSRGSVVVMQAYSSPSDLTPDSYRNELARETPGQHGAQHPPASSSSIMIPGQDNASYAAEGSLNATASVQYQQHPSWSEATDPGTSYEHGNEFGDVAAPEISSNHDVPIHQILDQVLCLGY